MRMPRALSAPLSLLIASTTLAALSPDKLRCEHQTDPLGVDAAAPRLSWIVKSDARNQKQSAYQILVAGNPADLAKDSGTLWDSGKVSGDDTIDITYAGKPLAADTICYWKVRSWDQDGAAGEWSQPAMWSVGLQDKDWTSQWVGLDTSKLAPTPTDATALAGAQWIWYAGDNGQAVKGVRSFSTRINTPQEKTIRRAVLTAASNGAMLVSIGNYRCISTDHGDPAMAVTADVTRDPTRGENPLTAVVTLRDSVEKPAFIASLVVDYEDGSRQIYVTDDNWSATQGAPAGRGRRGGFGLGGFGGPGTRPAAAVAPPPAPPAQPASKAAVLGAYPDYGPGKVQTLLPPHTPPSYERGTFAVSKPVQSAILYVTALGLCDVHLNGKRVTDDLFIPGWTDYAKRVYYRAYDVTGQINQGQNALGGVLTDGWYSGYIGWDHHQDHYGHSPRFRAEVHVKYADGSTDVFGTGPNWKAATGPITSADLQMGENYDARLENGWDTPAFDDSQWPAGATGAELSPIVQWDPAPPVRGIAEFTPVSINQPKPGVYVFNTGQYLAGAMRLKVTGSPGQEIIVRYGERLNPDGTLYVANLRLASATDRFICRGSGEEIFQPRFTFHGFQYIEVRGLTSPPTPETVTAIPYTSDTPLASTFETSDATMNRLHENVLWTQRANFIDIPTDCPQRDERQGWTGDAQVYCLTATLNTDVQGFFTKWTRDLSDAQQPNGDFPSVAPLKVGNASGGTGWADAGVIVPWTMYLAYGDKGLLERQYASMAKFVDFSATKLAADGTPAGRIFGVGDHLAPGGNFSTPIDIIFMCYLARSTRDVALAADALGKSEDAAKYHALFDHIKDGFHKRYMDAGGKIKNGTQAAYAMAVESRLLNDDEIAADAKPLADDIASHGYHVTTGFLGTRDLMLTLARMGRNDVAYKLIHQTTYPSWGFEIANGATSMWERWDGWTSDKGFQDPAMNSFAHYSFGAVYTWMLQNVGGIQSDGPAYAKTIIAPTLDETTTWAKVSYDSVRGPILVDWKRGGDKLEMNVTIPANTTATVSVPTSDPASVTESGKPMAPQDGKATYSLGSGTYHFEAAYKG